MRPKAAKVCPHHDCPLDQPCPEHTPKPWANAEHRRPDHTTNGWARQKRNAHILRRDHGICHVCGNPGATQVDHVIPEAEGGTSADSNLAPIHDEPCHRAKTAAEAARARR